MKLALRDSNKRIHNVIVVTDDDWPEGIVPEGLECIPLEDIPEAERIWVSENPLDDARRAKLTAIVARFDAIIAAGYPYPLSSGEHVALDDRTRTDLTALAMRAGRDWPIEAARAGFITIENNRLLLPTARDVYKLADGALGYYSAARIRARALKDAVGAAKTQEQLDAIDEGAGWP